MTEEEKKEDEEIEDVEDTEEFEDLEEIEEDENELEQSDIDAVPLLMCSDDQELMEIEDTEVREVEERGFLFSTNTEEHIHLKYVCPKCGKYYYHDLEQKRQGCFIATAAYGTSLAQEINVLRKFRDSYLVHKKWGKQLVNLYYTLSPPVANIIGKSENLKKVVRTCLAPIVNFFKQRYEDSN